jgi:hypothetical protein
MYYIFDESYWDWQMYDGPLHNRGWVFQKRFLAPCQIYFTRHQILWECLSDQKYEGFPQGIPRHDHFKDIAPLLELKQPPYGEMSY